MTRLEMIKYCVEYQIKLGIVKPQNKAMQIKSRLKGSFAMSKADCEKWYNEIKIRENN